MPLLTVLPVHSGDYELALGHLQRQQPCGHDCLLVLDAGLDKEQVKALKQEAKDAFAHVATLSVDVPVKGWPHAPNWVWQATVRYIEAQQAVWVKRNLVGWLWWEADALPLSEDWLDRLGTDYLVVGKPVMGHLVAGRTHLNGVAIYPLNLTSHGAYKAMLTRATPFDVALSSELSADKIHPANHLIAHLLKRHGGDPPLPMTPQARKGLPATCVLAHGWRHIDQAEAAHFNLTRKDQAMNETSKAMRRRRCEEAASGFKWSRILTGKGVDVGAGNDPVQLPGCQPFDMADGDANHLSRYIPAGTLDYIHASQALEHMLDPRAAILDWALCVRPGGHLVVSIPDWDLYEKCQWPSRFNPDHKSAWSTWRKRGPSGVPLVYVPDFCRDLKPHGLTCIKVELCCDRYDWDAPADVDQTLSPDGPEAFIELVFRKEGK